MPGGHPNVVLVVLDTARRDAIEPYTPSADTPTCRQIATEGSYHRNVYSTASWTVPSHASLFAGDLPRSVGFDHRGGQSREGYRLALQRQTPRLLPEVLRRHGYVTRGISNNPWVSDDTGFDSGFDTFVAHRSPRLKHHWNGGSRQLLKWYAHAARATVDDGARGAMDQLRVWLDEADDKPFFWFVNLMECHSPYMPPRPHSAYGPIGRIRVAHDVRRYQNIPTIRRHNLKGNVVPKDAIEKMRRQYGGEISYMDQWLAALRELLDHKRVLQNTLLIVTSDHGENFGDGGRLSHSYALNDSLIRVPLIWSGPVGLDLPRIATLAHFPSALCRAVGIDHSWPVVPGDGEIAVAQFDAPLAEDALNAATLAAAGLSSDDDPESIRRACSSFTVATDGATKLIRAGKDEELIDLHADPNEEMPTTIPSDAGDMPILASLRTAIDDATAAEVGRTMTDRASAEASTKALEDQMRLLGYL